MILIANGRLITRDDAAPYIENGDVYQRQELPTRRSRPGRAAKLVQAGPASMDRGLHC